MRRLLTNLAYLLPLSLWTGAAVGLTFLTTPTIFGRLDRDAASRLVSEMFPGYFRFGIICTAVALFAALMRVRAVDGSKRRLWAIPSVLALMLLLMVISGLVLEPRMAAVQAQIPSFVTDTNSPARQEFRRLHSISSILNVLMLALAGSAWVLTALDPRLLTTPADAAPAQTATSDERSPAADSPPRPLRS